MDQASTHLHHQSSLIHNIWQCAVLSLLQAFKMSALSLLYLDLSDSSP